MGRSLERRLSCLSKSRTLVRAGTAFASASERGSAVEASDSLESTNCQDRNTTACIERQSRCTPGHRRLVSSPKWGNNLALVLCLWDTHRLRRRSTSRARRRDTRPGSQLPHAQGVGKNTLTHRTVSSLIRLSNGVESYTNLLQSRI